MKGWNPQKEIGLSKTQITPGKIRPKSSVNPSLRKTKSTGTLTRNYESINNQLGGEIT
jgi:hypothetical protein